MDDPGLRQFYKGLAIHCLYPLYTGAATLVPLLCGHKTSQAAVEGRKGAVRFPWSFNDSTQDVQISPWTPWSPWSLEHVQNSHRGGRSLTGRSKEAGGRHTHRHGRWMDAQWSAMGRPVNKCVLLWTLCIDFSDASAFLVPPLCLLWPTNSVHWTITVATMVPPFGDHGNIRATLAMVLPALCLLCATCCATTSDLVVQGRHVGRAAAVTQKQNFLGLGDHWASLPFFGRSKVARRSQPCAKGALII